MDPKDLEDSKDQLPADEQKQEEATPASEGEFKIEASDEGTDTETESVADEEQTTDDATHAEDESAVETKEVTQTEEQPAPAYTESAPPEVEPSTFPATGAVEPSQKKPRKKLFVSLVLIVLGVLLLAGGAAAAYFGYIVPNKPENVLKDATLNTLQSQRTTFDGDFSVSNSEMALKAEFVSQVDADAQTSNTTIKLTISGVDFSLDARTINGNLYVKAGDLSTVESVIASSLTGIGSSAEDVELVSTLISQASGLLSEQWIEFDSTLLDQGGVQCVTDMAGFTEGDIQLLQDQFSKNPFITIDNHADESVDGVDTIKYELTVDNKKGVEYAEGLDELSVVKALESCGDGVTEDLDTEVKPDELLVDDTTKLTVWVDKSEKLIHKIAVKDVSTDKDTDEKLNFSTVLTYGDFTVEKPENSKPALQVWSELQGLLFGGMDFLDESEPEL